MEILCKIKDVSIVSHTAGRARQMNHGASLATGKHLLFLHADTILPGAYHHHITQILATPGVSAGAFRLAVDIDDWKVRLMERLDHWRSTIFSMPYGDQGIFLKTSTFAQAGEFPELPIMEDYELVRRLRRLGKIKIADPVVITSGRRWEKLGMFQTTRINWLMIWKYRQGVSAENLRSWYRDAAQNQEPW